LRQNREPLNTKDWREVSELANQRIAEIKAGKVASSTVHEINAARRD
jgi:hypothetical protein